MIRRATFNHRLAAAIFLLFTVGCFGSVFLLDLVGPGNFPAVLLWLLFWAFAVLVALAVAVVALFSGSTQAAGWRAVVDRLAPLAALAAALGVAYAVTGVVNRRSQMDFARAHAAELAGTPPRAVIYSEGIPDGGTAIVRLPGRSPETLPQRTMLQLTGERIKDCRALDDRDWFCRFD